MVDVSIVIVCMNNLKNLYPCLESIKKYTVNVKYETFVVAYLFTKDNLEKVKSDFPWVTFIESNEIRGFSENNNLALKQAKGRFCFVVNDDTYHNDAVIDNLVDDFNELPNTVAVLSPTTLNVDGSIQRCGKPKYNIFTYFLELIGMIKNYDAASKYTNNEGVFKTYNISGAAFMIRTTVFQKVGWFDEKYFFCPEDIALSTLLNKQGYECYVDADVRLTHTGGGTWSKTIQATKPATVKGLFLFYKDQSVFSSYFYFVAAIFEYSLKACYWCLKYIFNSNEHHLTMIKANLHAVLALFSSMSPKQLFTKFYNGMI